VLGVVAWDPRRAEVFADGADKPIDRAGGGAAAADRAFDASGYRAQHPRGRGSGPQGRVEQPSEGSLLREMIAARVGTGGPRMSTDPLDLPMFKPTTEEGRVRSTFRFTDTRHPGPAPVTVQRASVVPLHRPKPAPAHR
jgi:hypothetical protein